MAYVDDEKLRNQWNAQKMQKQGLQDYATKKEAIDKKYSTGNGGLSSLFSGLIKDAKAIGSTISDTGSVIGSLWNQDQAQRNLATAQDKSKNDLDAIARKYGYKDKDDAYDKGDGPEEMWKEFQDSTLGTRKKVEDISNTYKNSADYKRVQDMKQSEYGANALRTMKTLKDIMLPGAGLINGAVDGSIDALADNLERADGTLLDVEAGLSGGKIKSAANTGLDLGQTAKDMLVGGLAGAAGSAAAGRVGNATSGIGSRLLNNKLATSGIGRGAIAGAAGGAVGGGLGAALNGGDVLGSTLQGATSGAATGGIMGGVSSGARKLGTKATDALGITDNLRTLRGKFMYDPNDPGNGFIRRKDVAQTPETDQQTTELAKVAKQAVQSQPQETEPTNTDVMANNNRTSLAGQLRKRSAEKLLDQYGTISKPMAKSANAIENVQKVADAGFEKPGDVEDIISKITGSSGKVTKLTQNIVKSAAPVNTFDGVNDLIDDAIANVGLVEGNESSVRRTIEAKLKTLPSRREGSVTYQDNPEDVFKVVKNLEARSAELKGKSGKNYSTTTQDKLDQAKVLDALADELKNRIYNNAAPMDQVLTADVATDLKAQAPKNKKWADYVDNTIMKAQNIGELRSSVAPFVNMGKIIDDQYVNYGTYGQRVGDFSRDAGRALQTITKIPLAGQAVELAANSNVARRLASRGYRAASNLASRAQEGRIVANNPTSTPTPTAQPLSPTEQNMFGILGARIGENEGMESTNQTIKNREFNNLEEQLSNTMAQAEALYNAPVSSSYRQQTLNPMQEQLSNIVGAMNNAMAAGDISAYNELAKMYNTAYSIYKNQAAMLGEEEGGTSNLSTAEKNQLAKLQSAGTALDQLESLYTKAGGGQGIIGGNIANFLGGLGLNSDVNTYNQLAQGLINQIGAAIGKTDSLNTEGEVQRALSLVPKITDDNQTAMNKLTTLRQLLQQNTNSYNQLYGA